MKNRIRRLLVCGLSLSMAAGLLMGCGGSKESGNSTETDSAESAAGSTAEEADAGGRRAAERPLRWRLPKTGSWMWTGSWPQSLKRRPALK